MFSDRHRETLHEIERLLLSEDPEFVGSFEARAQRLPRTVPGGRGIKAFLVIGLLLSGLVLVAGSLGGAFALATATGVIWLAWRFARETPRRFP